MKLQRTAPALAADGQSSIPEAKASNWRNGIPCRLAALAVAVSITADASHATTLVDETVLDRIFSQESFGPTPIDIRLLPTITIESTRLSRVEVFFSGDGRTSPIVVTYDEAQELFDMGSEGPVLDFFVVDEIFFGGFRPSGIAEDLSGYSLLEPVFGNGFLVDRNYTFERDLIVAHEMGHTLGLRHPDDPQPPHFLPPRSGTFPPNLMNGQLFGSDVLSVAQVEQILRSDKVQGDAISGLYIEIQQYDVVRAPFEVAPVPFPTSAPLMLVSILMLSCAGRHRRRSKTGSSNLSSPFVIDHTGE
ncbi:MAG: hypothetical protein AAGK23_06135 [Pseudomonadota bacterium]